MPAPRSKRYPVIDDLTARVALVTGGSRGIGRGIALALARAGADVVVNCRTTVQEADDLCIEIQQMGRRALRVRADVSVATDVVLLFTTATHELGPVSILVNNAGTASAQPIDQLTEQSWNEVIANNLTSAFFVTQAALPEMRKKKWGRIINISSVAAQLGGVIGPHYAASKAGMIGLTHSYASLLANEGITVNAIAPALIETDMIRGNLLARPKLIPVGRLGTADEVAEVVVLLARNGYITGQTINVNGGWYMS